MSKYQLLKRTKFRKWKISPSFSVGEEEQEEVKGAVADEPEVEDAPQENNDESAFDEDDEQLEDEDENDESGKITTKLINSKS